MKSEKYIKLQHRLEARTSYLMLTKPNYTFSKTFLPMDIEDYNLIYAQCRLI